MRLLVVEDEPRLLRNLAKALREEGYAVDTAEAGDDGLFKAESSDYDAIVLDVMLPRLDGWQFLERLRKTRRTPVLMLTARDAPADRVRGLDTGADDYLVKPFEVPELLARVNEPRRPPPSRGRPVGPPPDGGPGPRGGRREILLPAETAGLFTDLQPDGYYFLIWSRDGSLLRRATNAPPDVPLPARPGRVTIPQLRTRDARRESYQFTELGDCVLAGRSLATDWRTQNRLAWKLLAAGSAVLALGLGGGWWLATRAIRPVEDISAAAGRISAGNLSERITTREPDDELGRLAGVLNSTFARLEAAFTRRKQFTADAAHELRTPIAVLISEAQTALARERTIAEYKETIEANLAAAQQMRRLTESLLAIARLDAGHEPRPRGCFDLAQKTRECVERLRPLAAERRIRIHCDLPATECHGDPERLGQVLTNLLTNAIHYNRDGGEDRVVTRTEDGASIVDVTDTGSGIAAADLPHTFERFYRADKSRSRAEGRNGLGLAISRAIVDAHGGTIAASSELGIGSAFIVRLPTR